MDYILWHPNLDHPSPAQRVTAHDAVLRSATAHLSALTAVHTALSTELVDVEKRLTVERGDRRALEDRRADLQQARLQLDRGVSLNDGTLPEVTPFVNTPGLAATRAAIERLTASRAEAVDLRDAGDALALYRLKEDVGEHHSAPGVRMFPGETIALTRTQFHAFQDKFEPVMADAPEEAAPAASTPG